MTISFQRATRTQKKLRMALMGPSGSGKTYTALSLAAELGKGGKVALLDTERGSASLYSDNFAFDACELESFNPQHYIDVINAAAGAGYTVLVIDSLSHAWNGEGGVLDQVNKRGGNQFTDGWGKVGTPLQNSLMKAILEAPMHIIATMRVKTEYVVEKNERGKSEPKRVGLAAVQRDGVEYEFDIIGTLDIQNTLTIEKTRMTALAGTILTKPDGKLAQKIMVWLSDGAPATPLPATHSNDAAPLPLSSPVQSQATTQQRSAAEAMREQHGQAIAAAGLVTRSGDRFNVKLTMTGGAHKTYEVWRDDTGKVRCRCLEFEEGVSTDPAFRCEHIIAVKYSLIAKNTEAVTKQNQPTDDPELRKDLEAQAQLTALYTEAEWTGAAFSDWLANEYHGMLITELSAEQAGEVIEMFKREVAASAF